MLKSELSYMRDMEGFTWSYKDIQNQKVILVADYYEKKKRRAKIVKLADGRVMTAKNYKKMEQLWRDAELRGKLLNKFLS